VAVRANEEVEWFENLQVIQVIYNSESLTFTSSTINLKFENMAGKTKFLAATTWD
jgi:hypothetical protein